MTIRDDRHHDVMIVITRVPWDTIDGVHRHDHDVYDVITPLTRV